MTAPWSLVNVDTLPDALARSTIPAGICLVDKKEGLLVPTKHLSETLRLLGLPDDAARTNQTSQWDTQLVTFGMRDNHMNERAVRTLIDTHPATSLAWYQYLMSVAQWFNSKKFPFVTILHHKPQGDHFPINDGNVHVFFGGGFPQGNGEWFLGRHFRYQPKNVWIGELGPEHSGCRDLIPRLLEPMMIRIVPESVHAPKITFDGYPVYGTLQKFLESWGRRICRNIVFHAGKPMGFQPPEDGALHIIVDNREQPTSRTNDNPMGGYIIKYQKYKSLHLHLLFNLMGNGWNETAEQALDACLSAWARIEPSSHDDLCMLAQGDEQEVGRKHYERQLAAHQKQRLDGLLRPWIRRVWYHYPHITLFTEPVVGVYPRNNQMCFHEVGQFRIIIRNAGEGTPNISFFNLIHGEKLKHHQWVNERGSPCFGTINADVQFLLRERRWSHLLDLVYAFLTSGSPLNYPIFCRKEAQPS